MDAAEACESGFVWGLRGRSRRASASVGETFMPVCRSQSRPVRRGHQVGVEPGSYPILKSWFDPVSNYFAVWTGQYMGPVAEGSVSFRLE